MNSDIIPLFLVSCIGFNAFILLKEHKLETVNNKISSNNEPVNNNENNIDNLSYNLLNRDMSVITDPLVAPEQRVETKHYPKIKLYERTRGTPDNYQIVGLLYNQNENIKYQLFGRKVYPGAYQWEYYIRGKDGSGLEFKFPLPNKEEIHDGSNITVPLNNIVFTVKTYNYNLPRYNPFIL